jgi:6,7-dimethyl-8-ribityllumazine synthase
MPRMLIIVADFYSHIADMLAEGASLEAEIQGFDVEFIRVNGAFEIPVVIAIAIESGQYDCYVALGCVIRGETTHYDYVCGESARGIMDLAINHKAAIGYGILTVENEEQALIRAGIKDKNKGRDAVLAAIQVLKIKHKLL